MLQESRDHEDDVRLVRRVQAGEAQAIDEILRRLRCLPVILSARNKRLGSPLDATLLQDLAQETIVAIWTRLANFTGASSLEAWVYRFCLHKHLAEVRNRGRRGKIESVASALVLDATSPSAEVDVDEELVQRSLDGLDETRARVVRLKHFEDLTFEEIGVRLAMSPNTAKTHYYRALKSLKDALGRETRRVP
jgi:RNA polymerase sigma-70 factor (ECF subfamily)